MLTSKERSNLRALAVNEESVCFIGKDGVTPAVIRSVSQALEARELVKITVQKGSEKKAKDLIGELSAELYAEQVQTVGSKIVLYRRSTKKDVKHLEF